jgi:hypothetical protein
LAGANEIYVSSDAHNYPGVDEVLEEYEVSSEQANVKGVSEQLAACRRGRLESFLIHEKTLVLAMS